ncbi:MAG: hypothetical protein KGO83_02115 [Paenibacillaceae bacterium]|nr:hypothetical protein [Paenibacillaceae bacterium]
MGKRKPKPYYTPQTQKPPRRRILIFSLVMLVIVLSVVALIMFSNT